MSFLPDEIFLLIFEYLPSECILSSCSLVCKYWLSNLCSTLELKLHNIKSHQIPKLIQCPMMKQLSKLNFSDYGLITSSDLKMIGECGYLQNLQVIEGLDMKFLNNAEVVCGLVFSKFVSKLRRIKIQNYSPQRMVRDGDWIAELLPKIAEQSGNSFWYHFLGEVSNELSYFEMAAYREFIPSLMYLGEYYECDENMDNQKSFYYFSRAAQLGNARAQFTIGKMYENGIGVTQSWKLAFDWYLKAANQSYLESIFKIGWLYQNGKGIEPSDSKAIEWYLLGARRNNPDCQFHLGYHYGCNSDHERAFKWYMKSAEQGYVEAIFSVGLMYEFGRGVIQDFENAFDWYLKAAKKGHTQSQYLVGIMLIQGKGTRRNLSRALKYLEQSAESYHEMSNILLGLIYYFGLGVEEDVEKSNELMGKCGMNIDSSMLDFIDSQRLCNVCNKEETIKGFYFGCKDESCEFDICMECYEWKKNLDLECKLCKGTLFKKKHAMQPLLSALDQLLEYSQNVKKKKRKKSTSTKEKKLFLELIEKLNISLQSV